MQMNVHIELQNMHLIPRDINERRHNVICDGSPTSQANIKSLLLILILMLPWIWDENVKIFKLYAFKTTGCLH